MSWREYVSQIVGPDRQVDIAHRTGIDQGTISRWMRDDHDASAVSSRSVRLFALGYGRPVLEAFVVAGFLTAEEAGIKQPTRVGWEDITNEALADEVRRRLEQPSEQPG
jgi:hypothetical protein